MPAAAEDDREDTARRAVKLVYQSKQLKWRTLPKEAAMEHLPVSKELVAARAEKTAIGNVPTKDALDLSGLDIPAEDLELLLAVDRDGWRKEVAGIAEYYQKLGGAPAPLQAQLEGLKQRLG